MQSVTCRAANRFRSPRKLSSLSATANCSHVSETLRIPARSAIINDLQSGVEYDVLIIGGGATGAGAALDARLRGLKVACVEREDFACKLPWERIRIIHGIYSI
jgi:NADPH-dependent 2,4-dienoyl-CoA reductase/sulfur reductase-like enzyme